MADREAIILAAIAATPHGAGKEWELAVARRIPDIIAAIGDGSYLSHRTNMMLEAQKFVAVLRKVEKDPKTERLLVHLEVRGEVETIRTEWLTSPLGAAMRDRLKTIPIGAEVLVWRHMETMASDPKKKTRVLAHIVVLKTPQVADAGSPGPSSAEPAPARRPSADPPRSDPPPAGAEDDDQRTSTRAIDSWGLTGPQLARVAQRCRAAGLENWYRCEPEDLDRVLVIVSEEKQS